MCDSTGDMPLTRIGTADKRLPGGYLNQGLGRRATCRTGRLWMESAGAGGSGGGIKMARPMSCGTPEIYLCRMRCAEAGKPGQPGWPVPMVVFAEVAGCIMSSYPTARYVHDVTPAVVTSPRSGPRQERGLAGAGRRRRPHSAGNGDGSAALRVSEGASQYATRGGTSR